MSTALVQDRFGGRMKWSWVGNAGLALFVCSILAGQAAMGVDPRFSLLVCTYACAWFAAVRVLGGALTLTGACVGLMGMQHVLISQAAKLFMGQRPDTPLYHPVETMAVNTVGMIGILAAAIIVRLVMRDRIKSILMPELRPDRLKMLALIFTVLMLLRYVAVAGVGGSLKFLIQFEFLTPFAIATATGFTVLSSKGKRFFSPLNFINVAIPLLNGMAFAQRKESAYAVIILIWAALMFGYRFRPVHYAAGALLVVVFQYLLFPFALYARGHVKGLTFGQRAGSAFAIFQDVLSDPIKYKKLSEEEPPPSDYYSRRLLYYGATNPTLDRMSIIPTVDAMIHSTKMKGTTGWDSITRGFEMVIPRAFNPGKNNVGTSNSLARRAEGLVGEEDFKTSITMGFIGESFVAFGWKGVFCLPFLMAFTFFMVYRIVVRDSMSRNIWASALVVSIPWVWSEGTFQQNIIQTFQNGLLIAGTGFLILVLANSLVKKRNLDAERVCELTPVEAGA